MIGHLQTNKVKDCIRDEIVLIHSVDSLKLAKEIDKESKKRNKITNILIEINIGNEETKFGISPNELEDFLKQLKDLSNINVQGLMSVAPNTSDTSKYFREMKTLATKYDLKELSIVLGLNNNSNQLNNISLNKKKNSFISAISDILYSNNLDELFEPIETETSSNEMLDNFIKNAKIEGIGSVKLELYKDSNFIENIKGDSNILSKPQIDFSNEYITKLQTI